MSTKARVARFEYEVAEALYTAEWWLLMVRRLVAIDKDEPDPGNKLDPTTVENARASWAWLAHVDPVTADDLTRDLGARRTADWVFGALALRRRPARCAS